MKIINSLFAFTAVAIMGVACDPIEDKDLREDYFENAGAPISSAELSSALLVTQPFPNADGVIKGDQYVVLKNNMPSVGGNWHLGWSTGEKIVGSDNDTVIYESNGTYKIYYQGISNGQIVTSDTTTITVTNVFDEWAGLFTNAQNKADNTAKKTWGFRTDLPAAYNDAGCTNEVAAMIAHGYWKNYPPERFKGNAWWGYVDYSAVGDQTMVFEYAGQKMTTYKADGTVNATGSFAFTHETIESGVLGWFITTVPVIGSSTDDLGQGSNNKFYLLDLTQDYITLYHPSVSPGADWGDYGWTVVLKSK